MCGIAGIFSPDSSRVTLQRLKAMTDTLVHRGPEGEGFWINDSRNCGLGHRRLCIIDLTEAAAQPMHYLQRYSIIYNGEIYNYQELKEDLQKKGYHFHSESDTEVILAAYACYQENCTKYFDGMFAFVIWDEKEKLLFAARDRFGEKPLYFYQERQSGELLFASEMKALWAAGVPKQLDHTMVLNYLTLGWTEDPTQSNRSFYNHIQSLPPAHYFILKRGESVKPIRYWTLSKETVDIKDEDVFEQFNHLFATSVSRRMRSDVPIGTSLSGGLDSSSIVATAAKFSSSQYSHKCFSAVFPGFEKDESAFIHAVTKNFQLDSYTISPTAKDLLTDLNALLHTHEQPIATSSVYAQYKVYQLAGAHGVTVLLDGQGADEIFAGYLKYIHWYLQEVFRKSGSRFKKEKQALEKNGINFQWGVKNKFAAWLPSLTASQLRKKTLKQQKNHPDINPNFLEANQDRATIFKPVVTELNDLLHFNTSFFGLQELLRYADRNSMAHSREVRLPFLQHELVEFMFSLPAEYKIHEGWTKWLLRTQMQNRLPQEVVWRKDKIGYETPEQHWLSDPQVKDYLHEAKKHLAELQFLRRDVADKKNQPLHNAMADDFNWRYIVMDGLLNKL